MGERYLALNVLSGSELSPGVFGVDKIPLAKMAWAKLAMACQRCEAVFSMPRSARVTVASCNRSGLPPS